MTKTTHRNYVLKLINRICLSLLMMSWSSVLQCFVYVRKSLISAAFKHDTQNFFCNITYGHFKALFLWQSRANKCRFLSLSFSRLFMNATRFDGWGATTEGAPGYLSFLCPFPFEVWWWCEWASLHCLLAAVYLLLHPRTPPPPLRPQLAADARQKPYLIQLMNRLSWVCLYCCFLSRSSLLHDRWQREFNTIYVKMVYCIPKCSCFTV